MRFHQVKELVSWAADYHARLASAYTALAGGKVGERERMALRYLAEHEHAMQASLEQYLEEASEHRSVLDTWFEDPIDFPHEPVFARLLESIPGNDMPSALATALTTHRTLQDLYADRANHAVTTTEREFFESLVNGHKGEVRRLSRDMQRLEDY